MVNWRRLKIGKLCTVLNGFAFESEKYVSKGIRVIRITNVQKGYIEDTNPQYYPFEMKEKIDRFLLCENDLLMSLTGNVGRVGLIKSNLLPAALNQRVACLRVLDSDEINIEYLFTFLHSNLFEKNCIEASNGIAQKNLSTEWLKEYEIPLPPLKTQIEIARNLSKMSRLIDLRKQQIEKMGALVKSQFVEMFGDPVTNPMGWIVVPLNEMTTKIGSGATPRGGNAFYIDNGISLIRSMNVYNGFFMYEDLAHINDEQARLLNGVTVSKNDVLINITGASVARSCIVPSDILPARVNQHVSILRCKSDLNYRFLNSLLTSDSYQRKLLSMGAAGGATRQAITKQQLEQLSIILPPFAIQERFAAFVEQVDKSKFVIHNTLEKVERNCHYYI